jgi:two-component system LytT family response regulator
MLKAIVIDDELIIRKLIIQFLSEYNRIEVVGECGSVEESEALIKSLNPDIVFLDINLSDGSGFDLLKRLSSISFKLIFITSYSQYAIKAIKVGAFDYILKPICNEEMAATLNKVLNDKGSNELVRDRALLSQKTLSKRNSITVKSLNSLRIIYIEEIIYCKSANSYTIFFLENGDEIISSKTLKEYCALLPEELFIRVHKSYLINISLIKEYKSEGVLVLSNGSEIPVAARRKENLLKLFM